MRKKLMASLIVAVTCLVVFQLLPVLASENSTNEETKEQKTTVDQENTLSEIKNLMTDIRKQEMSKFINDIKNGEISVNSSKDFRTQKDNETFEDKIIPIIKDKLNISTEGKDLETIREEVANSLLILRAKELGISTDGKDQDQLIEEIQSILEKEKSETKTLRKNNTKDISPELYKEQILNVAKALGIDTKNKSLDEITKELEEYHKNNKK